MLIKKILLFASCIFFVSCNSSNQEKIKLQQYLSQGKLLYETHCQNCHQVDGSGVGKLIPPLNGNLAQKDIGLAICAIKFGLEGVLIDGDEYFGKMPGNTQLTSLEIAEITTYISNNWGKKSKIVAIHKVDSLLRHCQPY